MMRFVSYENNCHTFFSFIIEISSSEDPSDFLLGLFELDEVIIGNRLHSLTVFRSLASLSNEKYMIL